MQWIIDNWIVLLLIGGMLVMHLFGHGHGHGKSKRKPPENADAGPDRRPDEER